MPEIQPFYVYPLNEDEAHLCPVCAMAEWINASQITSGFMFQKSLLKMTLKMLPW